MTGNGAHGLDQIQWALGTDETGPVEIWPERDEPLQPPVYAVPESRGGAIGWAAGTACSTATPAAWSSRRTMDPKPAPSSRASTAASSWTITASCANRPNWPTSRCGSDEPHLAVSDDHFQNWFDAIKSRGRPIADVEIGHRSAVICHLANIARWLGRRLHWDPVRELFRDDDQANQLLAREQRPPYQVPDADKV